jgi:SAM-dependent methyltransferase
VRPKKKRTRAWFEEVFDDDYLRTLPFLTPQTTQREAAFLVDALAVKPGHHILDVGCGYGRHSMELAARGFHVTALDLSLALLLRGADEAQRRGLSINFVHGDMRDMSFENQFDGAFCLFSTFGFFDDEMNKKVALHLARALKPGGRLVLDVLNRDYIAADLPTRVWWEGDGCVVLEEVDFNYFTSRVVSSRSVVFEDGRQLEQEISIRAYALHELGKVLHGAGFRVLEVSGNLAARGRFFGKDSRNLWIVAEKRSDREREPTVP